MRSRAGQSASSERLACRHPGPAPFVAALIWSLACVAQAQTAPRQSLPTREEVTRPVTATPPPARLTVDNQIERSPCPLADAAYAAVRIDLTSVSFSRLKGVTEAELRPVYQPYLGPDRPVSDICEIRDAVATTLRRKGFLAAVQVPTQQIEGGAIRFEVLFARLVAIRVRGDAGRSEHLVAAYLERLTEEPVFNERTAERALLLARDLPGLEVRLALKPTGRPGEVYGEVTLERLPIEADLNIQNFAAESTGRFGGQARVRFNGLTGLGDQTTLALYSTAEVKEQQVLQLGHEFRLGDDGLTMAARSTYAWTRPDLDPAEDLLRAGTLFVNAEGRYPWVRTQASTLWTAAGMDFVDQAVRFDDVRIAKDRLRVAYLRLDGDLLDPRIDQAPRWRLAYSAELRQGVDILDTSEEGDPPSSRADGDAEALLVRGSALGEFAVAPNLTLAASAVAQYAFDPLLSFEEISGGTYTIGRGYDPGALLGDDGVGLSAELRIDRVVTLGGRLAIQPFVFIDAMRVRNKDAGTDDLASAGFGARATFADRFRLDLSLAAPMTAAGLQSERPDPRILVSFTTRLWPWRTE